MNFKNKINELLYILKHPEDGYNTIHTKKTGSVAIALFAGLLWFFSELFTKQYKNFRFNETNKVDINILYIFLGTFVVLCLFALSNWAICTLFDGEGTLKEIIIVSGYALYPYVLIKFINIILSYFLNLNEGVFITILTTVGLLYSVILICVGLMQIHNYSFLKLLASVIATLVGICLILALVFLMFTLFQQLYYFIYSIFDELMMRSLH